MNQDNSSSYYALAFLVIAACFVFSWKYTVPKLSKNRNDYKQVSADVAAAEDKLESLKTAKTDLDKLGDTVNQLFIAAPKDADEANLLTELEAIAAKHQTFFPTVTISDGDDGTVSISLGVVGAYDQLRSFMASLENDIRFMNIKTVSLTSSEEGMTLGLQIEAYKRVDSAQTTSNTPSSTSSGSAVH